MKDSPLAVFLFLFGGAIGCVIGAAVVVDDGASVVRTCDDYRTRAIDQCRADHGSDVGAYLECVGELPRCE